MSELSVVVKLSKFCNMRCTYCFEYEWLGDKARISASNLQRMFRFVRDYAEMRPSITSIRFVLHGGEPLILPVSYYEDYFARRHAVFEGFDRPVVEHVQTNLLTYPEKTLALLRREGAIISVSWDAYSTQRVNMAGDDTSQKVWANIERLRGDGIETACITVLTRENLHHVEDIFDFFNAHNLNFRLLSILDFGSPPPQIRELTITQAERLDAFKRLANRMMKSDKRVSVSPLESYIEAAASAAFGLKRQAADYRPAVMAEWALIIDVNGDVYANGDCYEPEGLMGNAFRQSAAELFSSHAYAEADVIRMARATPCRTCAYAGQCDKLDLIEAYPSDRTYDTGGQLTCGFAKPLLDHLVAYMRAPLKQAGAREEDRIPESELS